MYSSTVFIISKRKELSVKYKKIVESLEQEAVIISSLSSAIDNIQKFEPELLIVSDTIDENLSDFCSKIRALTFNVRPVIIAISKSSDLNDRLEILDSGADDFLSESINPKELKMRIKAHLRRYLENSFNPITFFAQKNLTTRALKKHIAGENAKAVMFSQIKNIKNYREIYGDIAYQKVLQTLGAIVNSTLSGNDFVGHFFEDEFIIITQHEKAEKMAKFLTFAFDNVLERFYNEADFKNKFTLLSSDNKEEQKEDLMKLHTCSLISTKQRHQNYSHILTDLFELIKLCNNSKGSNYVIDRIKLQGKSEFVEIKNKVMVLEFDKALSLLIKTHLDINEVEHKAIEDSAGFVEQYGEYLPNVLIIDYGNSSSKKGLELLYEIKNVKKNTKIIFTSSIHLKEEILNAGADFYLPKPYEMDVLMKWVKKFLN